MSIDQIAAAQNVARMKHKHQIDKAGTPYIEHVESVARNVEDSHHPTETAIIAAWLHDTVEDTPFTIDEIRDEFGANVAEVIHLLTRKKGQSPQEYYAGIKANTDALTVKLADIRDNTHPARLSRLPQELQDRLKAKYSFAIQQLASADGYSE